MTAPFASRPEAPMPMPERANATDRVYEECKDRACRSRKVFGRHKHCRGCDYPVAVIQGGDYCGECMCEDDGE